MKRFDHIPADDTRCWCAPKRFVVEESVTNEIFPDIFVVELHERTIIIHHEPAMEARRHGRPLRNKHLGNVEHL